MERESISDYARTPCYDVLPLFGYCIIERSRHFRIGVLKVVFKVDQLIGLLNSLANIVVTSTIVSVVHIVAR